MKSVRQKASRMNSLLSAKITCGMSENETEIDLVLVGKNNRKYFIDVKAIGWELQQRPVVIDIDKTRLKKVVKKE